MSSPNVAPLPFAKRQVSWTIIWHLVLSARLFQLGIIPFVAGIAFTYCSSSVIFDTFALRGATSSVNGHVYFSQDTGGTKNSVPIYVIKYSYVTPDGVSRTGVSYGKAISPNDPTPVTVQYSKSHPEISKIKGMKNTNMSQTLAYLSLLLLLGGLASICFGLFDSYKLYFLLRQGSEGVASLLDKTPTKKMVNLHPVYQYYYSFKSPSGQIKQLTVSTFEWLNDSQSVLFTDQWNETCALVVGLPGKLIVANGQITSHANLSQIVVLPAIAVAIGLAIVVVFQ